MQHFREDVPSRMTSHNQDIVLIQMLHKHFLSTWSCGPRWENKIYKNSKVTALLRPLYTYNVKCFCDPHESNLFRFIHIIDVIFIRDVFIFATHVPEIFTFTLGWIQEKRAADNPDRIHMGGLTYCATQYFTRYIHFRPIKSPISSL